MGIEATFHSLKNKYNSTIELTGGRQVDCELRSGSSQKNPLLKVRGFNVQDFNFVKIPYFERIYTIENKEYDAELGVWYIDCKVDVLKSFRDDILNSTQMVTRTSDVDQIDYSLADSLAVPRCNVHANVNNLSGLLTNFTTNIWEMLVVVNTVGNGYICMTMSDYNALMNAFMGKNDPLPTEFFSQEIARQFFNPTSYIISQMAFPIVGDSAVFYDSFHPKVGWWEIDEVTCHYLRTGFMRYQSTTAIGVHPQCEQRELHYLNYPPYRTTNAYVAGFGMIPLDDNKILPYDTIDCELIIDFMGGGAKLTFRNKAHQIIGYSTASMGMEIAKVDRQPANIIGVVQNALTGGAIGGPVGALAGGLNGAIREVAGSTSVSTMGSTGGIGGWVDMGRSVIQTDYKLVRTPSNYRLGKPCYKNIQLRANAQGSYVECLTGRVNCKATYEEQKEIENLLKTGIYLD